VKRFFGTIWIEELSRHVGRRLPKERLAGAAPTELECLFCPGWYEHFSSYGTETLQSHFCLPNTIGWQPAIQSLGDR
jgi:hypothetical protein